jgi:hypothetical protein
MAVEPFARIDQSDTGPGADMTLGQFIHWLIEKRKKHGRLYDRVYEMIDENRIVTEVIHTRRKFVEDRPCFGGRYLIIPLPGGASMRTTNWRIDLSYFAEVKAWIDELVGLPEGTRRSMLRTYGDSSIRKLKAYAKWFEPEELAMSLVDWFGDTGEDASLL